LQTSNFRYVFGINANDRLDMVATQLIIHGSEPMYILVTLGTCISCHKGMLYMFTVSIKYALAMAKAFGNPLDKLI